jgi:hypothetical protein
MRKISISLALAVAALAFGLPGGQAFAQATRTWVSGVGDDANPCSRTAPCKTFAGAISKTAPGGEIDALDPGGFGAVTITKSITIDGGGGQVASVLVAGTNGIVIAAASNDVIILRNLRLNGILGNGSNPANAGLNGIRFMSGGVLMIENVEVFSFAQSGIDLEPSNTSKVLVSNTQVQNCGVGNASFAGVLVRPTGNASMNVTLDRVVVQSCPNGVRMDQAGGGGVSNLIVRKSAFAGSSSNGVFVTSAASQFNAVVSDSTLNSNGGSGAAVSGSGARMFLGGDTITENVTGVSNSGGTLQSFKNNQIVGNLNDGTPITAVSSGGLTLN